MVISMKELDEPFKKDKKGLWYIDSRDITIKEKVFPQCNRGYGMYQEKRQFFEIDGINDLIIKDSTMYPVLFNRTRNLALLKELVKRQGELPEVDFPVAYYKSFGILKGIVVPYYRNAPSLSSLTCYCSCEQLLDHYHHDDDVIDNFVSMLLDVLNLLIIMYNKGVYYTDAHSGNFVIDKNTIKVIDFEPEYVFFSDIYGKHLKYMLRKYESLVNAVGPRCGFVKIGFKAGEDFYTTEKKVMELRKKLER